MSTQIANVNLAGAVVGQSGTVSWAQLLPPPTIAQQMRPIAAGGSNISLFNESPCLLTVTLPVTGQTFTLPAGRWVAVALPPLEISLTWSVTATAGSGLFNALLVDFFAPGETPHPIGTLGNSPISGSITTPSSPANSFEQDFFNAGFVLTGLVGSKDLSIANQLDVTAGIAFLKQADSSWGRVAPSSSTYLTSTPSATYFLDLNPDGSFSFGTSHSVVSNHITICSLTTDGSGNILVVTDARVLNATMLSAMSGSLSVPPLLGTRGGRGVLGTLASGDLLDVDSNGNSYLKAAAGMTINFQIPSGTSNAIIGSSGGFTKLGGQAAAGNFGVPVIVASVINQAFSTSSATPTIINTFTLTGAGPQVFRCNFAFEAGNSGNNIQAFVEFTTPGGSLTDKVFSVVPGTNAVIYFSGASGATGGGFYSCLSFTIAVQAGATVKFEYANSAGTVNDHLTYMLERLA